MATTKEAIDYRFKILYCIAIIMVVCGHTSGGSISLFSEWFQYGGVHLAIFMFGSGYFFQDTFLQDVKGYIIKKVRRLIVPLYIYNLVYGILVQLLSLWGFRMGGRLTIHNLLVEPLLSGHQFIYNLGGWFVIPLFTIEIVNCLFRKLCNLLNCNISEYLLFLGSIILGISGNQLACLGYSSGWTLTLIRILYFLPFYSLGILYKSKLEIYDSKIPGIAYFSFIFIVKLAITIPYGRLLGYTPAFCQNFYDGPVMPILVEFLGIAFWLRISQIIEPAIGKNKYVNLIADNTYSIMINQFIGFMVIKTFYAVFYKLTGAFVDFDMVEYKTNIWYYYIPNNVSQALILYLIAGIIFPILLQKTINSLKTIINWKFLTNLLSKTNFVKKK